MPPIPPKLPPLRSTSTLRGTHATVLLYAPARWGKTHLIRTAKNPLILSTELGETRGLQTLANQNIPFIGLDDEKTALLVARELSKHKDKVEYAGQTFDTVILDSLSQVGELWMEGFIALKGWDMVWDYEPGKDPRQAYSYAAERGRQLFKALMDIPCHMVAFCREQLLEEGEGTKKITFAAPELPGQKLGRELPGWPDGTLRGDWINGKRLIRTRTSAKAVAGIRVDFPVPEFIIPDLEAICRLVTGDQSALEILTPKPENKKR